jgi:hypothetical protein
MTRLPSARGQLGLLLLLNQKSLLPQSVKQSHLSLSSLSSLNLHQLALVMQQQMQQPQPAMQLHQQLCP